MKKLVVQEKNEKAEKAKVRFLKELNGAIRESNRASQGEIKLNSLEDAVGAIEKKHGGKRPGSGRKVKEIKKVTHGVKLTPDEHKAIVKKYGSFAKGVRTLIPKELAKV